MTPDELRDRLAAFLQRSHNARSVHIDALRLLTGGASRQTWSFDATIEDADGSRTLPLVLRSNHRTGAAPVQGELEYRLLKAAHDAGVAVPRVDLFGDDSLDRPFFLMERVDGETIPRRLLRDDAYAQARASMTAQLGATLARIHRIDVARHGLEALPAPPPDASPAASEVDRYEQVYRAVTPEPHPAFELAFRWLRERLPAAKRRTLVHGDYRIGNVIFGPEGARSILDWELAHVGDPMEDLGWFCVRSWRFGNDGKPAGGLGSREELWRAYEDAGGDPVDADRARFWEAFGNLRWGVICITQAKAYLDRAAGMGAGELLEHGSIGRRIAETEWELLDLMGG